ncbi:MAG: S8 family serine peptidase [Synergistaceae bacterium]|nr:S8 family serine peptidase [Synergistaceae bacterium]
MLYKKIFALILVLILAVSSSAQEYTPGDVIVVLKPASEGQVTASSLSASASEFAGTFKASVKEIYPALSIKGGGTFMMIHSESQDAEELSATLRQNPNVLAVSPNYKVHAAIVPNDSYYGDCWGMDEINAPSAWNYSTGDDTVYVAVIDSGIDDTNPDLTANVATELSYNTVGGTASNGRDDYGHGTHVAGTIGAVGNNSLGVAGLNWNAKLIAVKALDNSGNGTLSTVINAVNYVTDLIVNRGINVRAVNLSLETYLKLEPTHDNLVGLPLWRAFKILDDTNQAVIVVAAGNNQETVGQPSKYGHGDMVPGAGYYEYPASFKGLDNMISVSALDRTLGYTHRATFSNDGANIGAPGVDILSTWLQSASGYIKDDGVSLRAAQGTSMAAPHVAGTAALLASYLPSTATAYQIRQCILIGDELDVYASMRFAETDFDTLAAVGTEGRDYDDYLDYNTKEYSEPVLQNNVGSSGGCGTLSLGLSGAVIVLMLARKRMS